MSDRQLRKRDTYSNNTVMKSKEQQLDIVNDYLRKSYLTKINQMDIAPISQNKDSSLEADIIDNIRLYRITEMVYQMGEPVTDKFTTVFNTISAYNASIFIVIDSNGKDTNIYLGVRNNETGDLKRSTVTLGDTLKYTLIGNFPGVKIQNEDRKKISELCNKISNKSNVTSVSVVANHKNNENKNEDFVQGLEKLILAMYGKQYTGVIIAENQPSEVIQNERRFYQDVYTKLSPLQKEQFTSSETKGESGNKSFYQMNKSEKGALIASLGLSVGGTLAGLVATNGTPLGAIAGSQVAGQLNGLIQAAIPTKQVQTSTSHSYTSTTENKSVTYMLSLLDELIDKTDEYDSYGMWNVAGYFISDDMSTAEIAASNYRSLMNGEKSGREVSAINSWRKIDYKQSDDFNNLTSYLSRFVHPQFFYWGNSGIITASTSISGKELGLHLGLPRSTVPGLPVIEHAEFGKEVTSYKLFGKERSLRPEDRITLGKVFDLGQITNKEVELDNKSLNMHTFITGSTGSGKSNTVYQMLTELHQDNIPFLVVEPAKGEYKDVFGHWDDVNVYSSNPNVAELININPFKFPQSIHVLEHVDGLVEIFSVCWPMYDAMPAFFKDAILKSYEYVGWDLGSSTFDGDIIEYPNFEILVEQLEKLINSSDYASDIKSNYRGALITRVKSLTVGLNKFIFTNEQTPYEKLFDHNCILDISRIKSSETKALIMGLMVYILNEYRVDTKKGSNRGLKHVTVLEEAHNLLKNTSNTDSTLIGKSVEMLTNTIAEIRTYGEGFIIVDQSPSSVDIAAIKNTNTKIVLRTPEANDREAIGRSMGLTNDQVNEIAKLPSGVAVVYQNDWVNPVLTMVDKADVEEKEYEYKQVSMIKSVKQSRTEIIHVIMQPWLKGDIIEYDELVNSLKSLEISRSNKKLISYMIQTYINHNGSLLWNDDNNNMNLLRSLLFDILDITLSRYNDIKQFNNPNILINEIKQKTLGFTNDELIEICHILTMGD